jgi:hypothetical protein
MELPAATAEDERRHQPDETDLLWNESHYLDFFTADGSLGGYLRIGLYPNLGVAWYWACVVGRGRPLVTLIDNLAPLPTASSLEIRTDGLWCDHNVETPLEHFSVGLEGFGIALDDPADVYRAAYGDRRPMGFDLEWETDGNVFRYPGFLERYEIPCRVHGEILVGDERIDFDGFGQRDHSWGNRDWWATGWCWTAFRMDDGSRFHAITTKPSQGWGFGYDQEPVGGAASGPPLETLVVTAFDADEVLGAEGIPIAARLTLGDRVFDVEPIAWSPVLLTSPDDRESRFPRGLCTFTEVGGAQAGRTGHGWIEFNQPPGI